MLPCGTAQGGAKPGPQHRLLHLQAGRQAAPCTCDGVWVVLVCLELVEHVCRGVQGAGPDEAQAGEVQAEQRDLAHQGVQLHIVSNFTGGLQQGW